MKNLLTLALFVATYVMGFAQINVSPIELVRKNPGEFTEEQITKLKNTKTIFFYRDSDNVEELEKAIRPIWTITEISFVPFSKWRETDFTGCSIFSIGGVNSNYTSSSGMSRDNTHIYLNLWIPGVDKKNRDIKESYARIELHPTFVDYQNVTIKEKDSALEYIYDKGTLKNWSPGLLRNYLQIVNNSLLSQSERWLFVSETDNPKVKKLKNSTLYITDYAMVEFGKFTGDESKNHDPEKIFKSYPYTYELIDAEDLSEKILSGEEFYYMVFVKSSTDKYLTIFNSVSGEIIYSKYSPASYNVKDSDFKDLAKSMK